MCLHLLYQCKVLESRLFLVVCFFPPRMLLNEPLTFKSGYFSSVDVSTVVPFTTLMIRQQASRCIINYFTLRYVTLRYVTLRYVTLRYVTLHYSWNIYCIWLFFTQLLAHRYLHRHLKINFLIFLVESNENLSHIGTGHVTKRILKVVLESLLHLTLPVQLHILS